MEEVGFASSGKASEEPRGKGAGNGTDNSMSALGQYRCVLALFFTWHLL